LLDAALTIVGEQGLSALTYDKLVEISSVSRGGVMHHFPTRRELLVAVVDEAAARLRASLKMDDGNLTPAQRLDVYVESVAGHPSMNRNALTLSLAENPELLQSWRDMQRELDDSMRAAGGSVELALARRLALDGLWWQQVVDPDRFSDEQRRELLSAVKNWVPEGFTTQSAGPS